MISIYLRAELRGAHWHVGVWSATRPGQTRGKCGELVFREEEWPAFRDALRAGIPGSELPEVMLVEESCESR